MSRQNAISSLRTLHKMYALLLCVLFLLLTWKENCCGQQTVIPESDVSLDAYDQVAWKLRLEMKEKGIKLGAPIFIRIFKKSSTLELWVQAGATYTLFKTYLICNFSGFLGPKLREGDRQSPEGFYTVDRTQLNPWSNYHLSFNLGYPNEYDMSHNRSGSALMVHGRCSSMGCFAMTDSRINEIYTIAASALRTGQQYFHVHIFPFQMTWENLAHHRQSEWLFFWENLKEGYDFFKEYGVPPEVRVSNKRYVFSSQPSSPSLSHQSVSDKQQRLAQLENQLNN